METSVNSKDGKPLDKADGDTGDEFSATYYCVAMIHYTIVAQGKASLRYSIVLETRAEGEEA